LGRDACLVALALVVKGDARGTPLAVVAIGSCITTTNRDPFAGTANERILHTDAGEVDATLLVSAEVANLAARTGKVPLTTTGLCALIACALVVQSDVSRTAETVVAVAAAVAATDRRIIRRAGSFLFRYHAIPLKVVRALAVMA